MITPATQVTGRSTEADDNLDHIYCCVRVRALCGADLSDSEEREMVNGCIVCLDLEASYVYRCPECGT